MPRASAAGRRRRPGWSGRGDGVRPALRRRRRVRTLARGRSARRGGARALRDCPSPRRHGAAADPGVHRGGPRRRGADPGAGRRGGRPRPGADRVDQSAGPHLVAAGRRDERLGQPQRRVDGGTGRPAEREPLLGDPTGLEPASRGDVGGAEQAERRRRDPTTPGGVDGPPQGLAAFRHPVEGEADLGDAHDANGIGLVHQSADRGVDRSDGRPGRPGRHARLWAAFPERPPRCGTAVGCRGPGYPWCLHRSAPSCRVGVVLRGSGTTRTRSVRPPGDRGARTRIAWWG